MVDKNWLTVDRTHHKRFEALPDGNCLSTHGKIRLYG